MKVAYLLLTAVVLLSAPRKATRDLVDLRHIGHVESKGRVQDNRSPVVEALIKAGSPAAVTFLQSKLDDRTRIPGHGTVLDFWPRVEVGHVALIVLLDLFTRADGTPTVPGLNWSEILDGHNRDLPAWDVYDNFVSRQSRSGIRRKVAQLLVPYSGNVVWDATERCFRPRT